LEFCVAHVAFSSGDRIDHGANLAAFLASVKDRPISNRYVVFALIRAPVLVNVVGGASYFAGPRVSLAVRSTLQGHLQLLDLT